MAQDTLDMACMSGRVPPCAPCRTAQLPLLGAHGYDEALFTEVAQNYTVPHRPGAIDTRVAKHLAGGSLRCARVCSHAPTGARSPQVSSCGPAIDLPDRL